MKVLSRQIRLFISPEEIGRLITSLRNDDSLFVIAESLQPWSATAIPVNEHLSLVSPIDSLIVATEDYPREELTHQLLSGLPFERGWVLLHVFMHDSKTLHMTTINYKSACTDGLVQFERLNRKVKKACKRGVYVVDLEEYTRSVWLGVYYSPGAEQLYNNGIVWKQYGVETQTFQPLRDMQEQ